MATGPYGGGGKERIYCSHECQQEAYRMRERAKKAKAAKVVMGPLRGPLEVASMTPTLVLGVTGSRYATSAEHRQRRGAALLRVASKHQPGDARWQLYHGDAPGADTVTAELCFERGYCWSDGIHARPAEWTRYGYGAGPRRNKLLVEEVLPWRGRCPVGWVAFPAADDYERFRATGKTGGSGTCDCIQRVEAAGVAMIVVPLDVSAERAAKKERLR